MALAATIGLTAMKLGAAFVSQSVGVLSEGIHSFLDLISAAISFFTVREAGKPADEDHPFGHGKIETLSSLFESLLLVMAALLIFYEGVQHFLHPEPIHYEGIAIATILMSIGISYYVYRHNHQASVDTESSALHVNALHFMSDVVASVGVLIGLVVLHLTGWLWIDPLIAFAVAIYILCVAIKQVYRALTELADTQLPEAEIHKIRSVLGEVSSTIETHDLRTRKSGATRHIDFHMVVCGQMSVEASHALCDQLEMKIAAEFPNSSTTIHVEPCEKERTQCHVTCVHFKKEEK